MYASLKSLKPWLSSRKNARRLTVLLCIASAITSLVFYVRGSSAPLGLLLLNLATLACLWLQHHDAKTSINFQPQELADRLLQVQENERHRLSRELHDDIGQLLTAAKLQLQWLQRRMPDELQGHCNTLRSTLDDTLGNVRDVSALLNPRQLASLGLEASLRAHLVRTLASSSVHWSLACNQRLGGIDEAVAMAVFRITQEAVTNMLRHAQADNLIIQLQRTPEGLALSIHDDGRGFVPARHPADAGQRGLAGMQERVTALRGSLDITSQLGMGTRIEAVFPWPARTQQRAESKATHDL